MHRMRERRVYIVAAISGGALALVVIAYMLLTAGPRHIASAKALALEHRGAEIEKRFGPEKAVSLIRSVMGEDQSSETQRAGIKALGTFSSPAARKVLASCMWDTGDGDKLALSLENLAKLDPASALDELTELWQKSPDARMDLAHAMIRARKELSGKPRLMLDEYIASLSKKCRANANRHEAAYHWDLAAAGWDAVAALTTDSVSAERAAWCEKIAYLTIEITDEQVSYGDGSIIHISGSVKNTSQYVIRDVSVQVDMTLVTRSTGVPLFTSPKDECKLPLYVKILVADSLKPGETGGFKASFSTGMSPGDYQRTMQENWNRPKFTVIASPPGGSG